VVLVGRGLEGYLDPEREMERYGFFGHGTFLQHLDQNYDLLIVVDSCEEL
jgi:hypothetical protein